MEFLEDINYEELNCNSGSICRIGVLLVDK